MAHRTAFTVYENRYVLDNISSIKYNHIQSPLESSLDLILILSVRDFSQREDFWKRHNKAVWAMIMDYVLFSLHNKC